MTRPMPRSQARLRTRVREAVTRADVLVFSGAMAIVALHAAVDSFIAPEPGTDAADHLLRGLASLAVLALGAVVYPRLPAGGRAALAGAFGAFGAGRRWPRDRGMLVPSGLEAKTGQASYLSRSASSCSFKPGILLWQFAEAGTLPLASTSRYRCRDDSHRLLGLRPDRDRDPGDPPTAGGC